MSFTSNFIVFPAPINLGLYLSYKLTQRKELSGRRGRERERGGGGGGEGGGGGGGGGGGLLGSIFVGYVPLASQNPCPIIVIIWPIIDPILVTFG